MEKQLKGFGLFRRSHESAVDSAEVKQNENRIFQEVCQLVRAFREKHPSVGYAVRLERSAPLEPGPAPSRYSAWLIVSLSRNQTILESGPDTTEWPDARDKITRVRGKKLTVSDAYARLIEEDLESITADYEASPGTYVENREASREMLAEACRVARERGFEYVGTTLAVSPYQLFDTCNDVLERLAAARGLTPVIRDFRPYYPEATRRSRELGMYRQNYCGCRFSAVEAARDRARIRDERKAAKK